MMILTLANFLLFVVVLAATLLACERIMAALAWWIQGAVARSEAMSGQVDLEDYLRGQSADPAS